MDDSSLTLGIVLPRIIIIQCFVSSPEPRKKITLALSPNAKCFFLLSYS